MRLRSLFARPRALGISLHSLRLEWLEHRELLTLTPELVADLNTVGVGTEFQEFAVAEDRAYFVAKGALGVTDGSEAGTRLLPVKDWHTEVVFGKLAFSFIKPSDGFGKELWRTDGTLEGTFRLEPENIDSWAFDAQHFTVSGDQLYFTMPGDRRRELWVTDGTSAGTRNVHRADLTTPRELTDLDGALFFFAFDDENHKLWKSDGTPAGTHEVRIVNSPYELEAVNGRLYFSARSSGEGNELWTSDGTAEGTHMLKALRPGPEHSFPDQLKAANDRLYFTADDGVHGRELWVSDGTSEGTQLVQDAFAGGSAFELRGENLFHADGDRLYFVLTSQDSQRWLWTSDGTASGSGPLMTLNGEPRLQFAYFRDSLLFYDGSRFWLTDGAIANTRMLEPDRESILGTASQIAVVGGRLVFNGSTLATGRELWVSDGTFEGTSQLAEFTPTNESSSPRSFFSFRGETYFIANDGRSGAALWKSTGSAEGTVMIHVGIDSPALDRDADSLLRTIVVTSDAIYFTSRRELWRTDGTIANTQRLHDGVRTGLAVLHDTIFFSVEKYSEDSEGYVHEVWMLDTKSTETSLLLAAANASFAQTDVVDDTLYFAGSGASGSFGLWRTDGTSQGTFQVKAFPPEGRRSVGIRSLTAAGDKVFFTAYDSAHSVELWATDGTEAGTHMVKDINQRDAQYSRIDVRGLRSVGGLVYFAADDGTNGFELWRSDGTDSGTLKMTEHVNGFSADPKYLVPYQGKMYFLRTGSESIWSTDGSVEGTAPVLDGPQCAYQMHALNGRLLYECRPSAADSSLRGWWSSDGTDEGTVQITRSVGVPFFTFSESTGFFGNSLLGFGVDLGVGGELFKLTAPLGDTNFDLRVDLDDLHNVRGHLGGYGFGDADHDGDVDLDDLNAVRNQFGDAPVSVAGGTEAPRRLKEAAGVAWSRAVDLLFAVDRTHADSAQSGSYWLLKPASHSSSSNGLRFSGPSRLGRT